ncbi:hypothetical protein BDQ17DRAFT_1229348 [Cyathus striatus]|nr:hypothetical protein BDQ17DRAFT_1229348 [Cyathus striatus]
MSALSFARQAFGREKPHSSVTDWVEILTASNIQEEAYDGIPELVDSINLQAAGPAEASRAIRKKLKHGNPHQQYRALLLKALVENCGQKFQSTFADGQLTDALRHLAADPYTDKRVKKKLMLVLLSWQNEFKDDPTMSLVANLYKQCKGGNQQDIGQIIGIPSPDDKRKAEKEEAKKKARLEKEEARERTRKEEEERRMNKTKPKRVPFDFEKDKPKVLASIVDASQASSNLVNAITLVNPKTESLQSNERVQECLGKAKQARKVVVRYIQLVENEDLIGTLIETNERIMSSLEMYDQLTIANSGNADDVSKEVASQLANVQISNGDGEVARLQEKQRIAVEKRKAESTRESHYSDAYIHPDLQDLSFGPLGASSSNLPPPLRPSTMSDDGANPEDNEMRGSLSDFSDYDSSDEETHKAKGTTSRRKSYITVSDDDGRSAAPFANETVRAEEDPFADPFADESSVQPSNRKW